MKILDVGPDRTAFNLMSSKLDVVRASYRDTTVSRSLLEPGRIYRIHLGDLMTGNTFKQGHRIRIHISASFFPNFSRNLHTSELESISTKMRTERITIHHDRQYPSRLIFPVVR